MAYNPQNSFRGDIYLKQGMDSVSNTIGQLSDDLKKQKEEIKAREDERKYSIGILKAMDPEGSKTIDFASMDLPSLKASADEMVNRSSNQLHQANIRNRDAVTTQILQELNNQKEINDRWKDIIPDLLEDPSLTDRQRAIIGSGLQLPAAAVTRLMEEHSNLTPSEAIDQKNADLREDEVEIKKRQQADADKEVEVTEIRPGLLLINDKNGPRVIKDPSFNQPVDPTSQRESEWLNTLLAEGKFEEAARYANMVMGPKNQFGDRWTAEDYKPKDSPESSETPKGKDYNIGGTSFKVLTR